MANSERAPSRRYSLVHRITLYQAIGKRITTLRQQASLSQTQLAEKVGASLSMMNAVERGSCAAPVWLLYCVAEELDCTLDDLCPIV